MRFVSLGIYAENTIFAKSKIIAADLSNAKLLNPDFTDADLSNTNLTRAYFERAKFARTRLSYADLSNTTIIECKEYSGLTCDQANFNNAFIDDERLVCYLRDHGGKNVPDAVTERNDIDERK
jgi:uncharacterized protein YjbI with pentapeptide repeats